ncbi:MAG: NAD-dependent epimerase/dehydratase family protein [Candidatus Omnitrophica bacterium]|nr:NAD-dependent epimerase/dehydratase family protein [Candidatus Omnitrophota bacterium]
MKILVTGGAGFIGSHLVDELVRLGHKVRVLDSLEEQVHQGRKPEYLNPETEYLWGDVCHSQKITQALKGIDAVYHLAAQVGVGQSMYELQRYVRDNSLGTAVLLETLLKQKKKIRKLVVASSMSIYGEGMYGCKTCGPITPKERSLDQLRRADWEMRCPQCGKRAAPAPTSEEKPLYCSSVYAITKKDQEELCLVWGKSYQIPTVALRFFNVYGTRQSLSNPYTGVAAIFASRIKNNRPPIIFEDGLQTRDFIHVSDLVQGLVLALGNEKMNGDAFNLGTGEPIAVMDIAKILLKIYHRELPLKIMNQFRAGDIRHCFADVTKIRRAGFVPGVRFEEGMRQLVEWSHGIKAKDKVERSTQELQKRNLVFTTV